jgi:hypothetical protein
MTGTRLFERNPQDTRQMRWLRAVGVIWIAALDAATGRRSSAGTSGAPLVCCFLLSAFTGGILNSDGRTVDEAQRPSCHGFNHGHQHRINSRPSSSFNARRPRMEPQYSSIRIQLMSVIELGRSSPLE